MAMVEQLNDRIGRNDRNAIKGTWKILRIAGWVGAGLMLLVPLVAMPFTEEVNWTISDFLFAAIILGSIGGAFEFSIRRSGDDAYRTGIVLALIALFLLVWSNAAVGFVGSGANAPNVLYFAMIFVPIVGSIVTGFTPKGMCRTMIATALVQALIAAFAFSAGYVGADERIALLAINAIFIAMWAGSALLFDQAARRIGSTQAADRIGQNFPGPSIHFLLSILMTVVGAILAAFMISSESEPGALPLVLVLIGMGWFFITLFRTRSGGNNSDH